ncbi:SH3 and multiple ankyrin repeat domains protein 3-like [Terrapene carolina triunguis]|uniref:SH3 and multiple ankyrin repeat domains protein 3-like n=1 Tax=Terrapene triunguis TaxID=2587831 RepID=UPI000E7778D2|nr:SH3 and multiple ankyrin repeat domains protein 3-like [Terrapene carolina triunguis]
MFVVVVVVGEDEVDESGGDVGELLVGLVDIVIMDKGTPFVWWLDFKDCKCMRLNPDVPVWVSKQRILCTLNHSLKDVLNYGLFQPAFNGRAGKFLDEERLLREYPLNPDTPVPYLEFRYKRRVYTQSLLDDKQFAKLHTKANLKKFMEYVQMLNVEKVCRLLEKGLDPNFHDPDTGECPLTMAAQLEHSAEVIKALKNGGAHLDFRTREGMTALHKAIRCRNHIALMTLLDLGASPDYKDSRGLTPLYHSAMVGGDPYCCELLLHDYAKVGCVDENGWQEIHQACRYGHVQHLEHLLFYGADMTSQNASGNTALHICALYNQESCARVLLFRGASKEIRNYNSQTAFQVAIIAGNFELAEIIKTHKESDVVLFHKVLLKVKRYKAKVILPHKSNKERWLHSLDVRRAIAFYIKRTKPFRKSMQLFVTVVDTMKDLPMSTQRISSWITTIIKFSYEQAKVSLPTIMTAHSTRAQASSAAFLVQVLFQDICGTATWSSFHTFSSHCAITQQAQDDASFGRAVLQTAHP